MRNATNNHAGIPHSRTLRNPLLYTDNVMMPSKNNQIMLISIQCGDEPTPVDALDDKSKRWEL